jgi:hypothetical protein
MAAPIGSSSGGNGNGGEDNGVDGKTLSARDSQSSVDSNKALVKANSQNSLNTLPPAATKATTQPHIDLQRLCQLTKNVLHATMEVATNHISASHKHNLSSLDVDEKVLLTTYDNQAALASAAKNLENPEYLNAMDLNLPQTTIDMETIKSGRHIVKLVPNELLPRLCKLLVESKTIGVGQVTKRFLEWYPSISKRQIELKIAELAVKEKTFEDVTKVWHIRPEYQYMLKYDTPEEMIDDNRPTFNKSMYALGAEAVLENGFSSKHSEVKKDVKQDEEAEDKKATDKIKKRSIKRTAFNWFCLDRYEELRALAKSEEELKVALIQVYDELTPTQRLKYQEKAGLFSKQHEE